MGRALDEVGFRPDIILSSTALRAKSTAEKVAREINFHLGVRTDANLYESGHGYITGMLQKLPDTAQNAMVFGHNPILEQLVVYLLQMQGGIVIPTSGMVCLEANVHQWADLEPGKCQMKWFLIPKLLS